MATTEITKQDEPLHEFMKRPDVLDKFKGLFPSDYAAKRHIQSVLLLVASAEPGEYSLQNCSNVSVLRSALRAASLRVSVDPAVRQAWLVPRKNGKTGKLEAGLQLHYNEIRNRAMRTNRYRFINVSPVYAGETVLENIYTGLYLVKLASGLMTSPTEIDGFVDVNERRGIHQGWIGYSETIRGARQMIYMSVIDIEGFVTAHNPYWRNSPGWKNNRKVMEQKTVLLALLRKSDLGDPAMSEIRSMLEKEPESGIATDDDEIVDGEPEYIGGEYDQTPRETAKAPAAAQASGEKPPQPEPELKYDLAKGYIVSGKALDARSIDELSVMLDDPKRAESTKKAIRVVLDYKVEEAQREEKEAPAA